MTTVAETGGARVRVEYPSHELDGRVFDDAVLQVLEIRNRQAYQDKEYYRRWRAEPSGDPGWLALDCWIVQTEDGPIGLPAAVCRVLSAETEGEAAPCPSA